MDSFALTLFVLCTCTGLLSVALMARWLRSQPPAVPDLELEEPIHAEPIVTPLAASRPVAGAAVAAAAASSSRPSTLPDDDTQPMTRTQAWGPVDSSDWPTTVIDPSQTLTHAPVEPASSEPGFADTQPLPVETVAV